MSVDDAADSLKALVNDVLNLDFDHPVNLLDVTGIDKSAPERLQGLADFTINMSLAFNDAASASFDVFKTTASSSQIRTVTIAISGQNLSQEVLFGTTGWSRAADGSFQINPTGVLANGTVASWS